MSGDLIRKFPLVPLYQQDLAAADNNLGLLLHAEGRYQDAARACLDGLNIRKELADHFPKPDYRLDLAKSYTNWGLLLQSQNQADKARQAHEQAVDLLARLTVQFPDRLDYQHELGRAYINLGTFQQATGQFQKADETLGKALEITARLLQKKSQPEYVQDWGRTHLDLGILRQKTRRYPEADKAFGQAVEVFAKLVSQAPEVGDYRYDLGVSHLNRGTLLRLSGRGPEAESDLKQAADLLANLKAASPARPGYRQQLARANNELGICLGSSEGRTDEARQFFRRALELQEKLAGEFPDLPEYRQEWARTANNLGILLTRVNLKEEALPNYQQAVTLLKNLEIQPAQPEFWRDDLVDAYTNLANLLAKQGPRQEEEAITTWRLAVDLQRKQVAASPAVPEYQNALVRNLDDLAQLLLKHNQEAEARRLLQEALRFQQAVLAGNPQDAAYREAILTRAEGLLLLGDHAKAARLVTDLAGAAPSGWPEAPHAAGLLAGCMRLVLEDSNLGSEGQRRLEAKNYGDQAVQLLRQAIAKGFQDSGYLESPVFQPLRSREDFQALLAGLTKPKTASK